MDWNSRIPRGICGCSHATSATTSRPFLLRCELDAAFFHLYGLARHDVDYVMDTFPLVRDRDVKARGEYRTKRMILEIYEGRSDAIGLKVPYQTRLDLPPADSLRRPCDGEPPRGRWVASPAS